MTRDAQVLIEGYTPDELLDALSEDREAHLFSGAPAVLRVGTAAVLGQFAVSGETLTLELAHIDGGGEGVLPTLASVAARYARRRRLREVEWIVYATACAKPNRKLRHVLERRGFVVRDLPGKGTVYYQRVPVGVE